MKLIKTNKGITLIALVITIAIMIILAIIAISSVNDTDILSQTEGAASRLNQLQKNEAALRNQLFDELKPGDDPTDGECKHNYEESYRVEEKCEVDGYIEYTCSICKDTYEEVLIKLEHDYKETIVAATCTEAGEIRKTCARCGKTNTTIVDSPGHKLNYTYTHVENMYINKHRVHEKCDNCSYEKDYEEYCSMADYFTEDKKHSYIACEGCKWNNCYFYIRCGFIGGDEHGLMQIEYVDSSSIYECEACKTNIYGKHFYCLNCHTNWCGECGTPEVHDFDFPSMIDAKTYTTYRTFVPSGNVK